MPPAAIPVIIAAATVASAGIAVRSGQLSKQASRRGLRAQAAAQEKAEQRASSEQRRAELESKRLNRRQVDPFSLLGRERELSRRGAAGTLLTGAGGGGRAGLTLGQGSLLGAGV